MQWFRCVKALSGHFRLWERSKRIFDGGCRREPGGWGALTGDARAPRPGVMRVREC